MNKSENDYFGGLRIEKRLNFSVIFHILLLLSL